MVFLSIVIFFSKIYISCLFSFINNKLVNLKNYKGCSICKLKKLINDSLFDVERIRQKCISNLFDVDEIPQSLYLKSSFLV